ncbi:hypothetical protein ACFX2I_042754 [Malus domestica]
MDSSNPFYVHHSDSPGHMLVPEKLNGSNYPSWSKSMIHALTAKNKIGFVDGSIQPPSAKDQPKEYALWNQCNSMILTWLAQSVEPDLSKGVVHAKSAQQVWEDFKDQFSQKNAPTIYQIQKSIASLSQGSMTVSAYFTKLKGLWDKLETYRPFLICDQTKAHNEQIEEDRMMQFLMGLNDIYSGVRSNILMMAPLPKVRQAYSLVIQDETQRQMSSGSNENFTIAAAVQSRSNHSFNNSKNIRCEYCDKDGHTIDNCRTRKYHCKFCDKRGHTEDRCRFKNGTNGGNHKAQQRPQGSSLTCAALASSPAANAATGHIMTAANAAHVIPQPQPSSHVTPQTQMQTQPSPNPLQGLSADQLQQLAHVVSIMNLNNTSGNSSAYANAAGLGYGEDDWIG